MKDYFWENHIANLLIFLGGIVFGMIFGYGLCMNRAVEVGAAQYNKTGDFVWGSIGR